MKVFVFIHSLTRLCDVGPCASQFRIFKETQSTQFLGCETIWRILTARLGVLAHVFASIFLTDVPLTDDSKPLTALGMLSAADAVL